MNNYTIDLSLQPSVFDLWHVCMAGTIGILALSLIFTLFLLVISLMRANKVKPAPIAAPVEPTVIEKIVEVEKIVEIEKIVQAPAPAPVVLKEATSDAALQLLSLLQNSARFIDFIQEDVTIHSDADVGMVARVVHEGCRKVIQEHFTLAPIRAEAEGSKITLSAGFDANSIRLTGNIVGSAPFTGVLIHKGWHATEVKLPKLTQGYNAQIIACAEVEL